MLYQSKDLIEICSKLPLQPTFDHCSPLFDAPEHESPYTLHIEKSCCRYYEIFLPNHIHSEKGLSGYPLISIVLLVVT